MYSQAAENNKQPIFECLAKYINDNQTILEIGSGTGQHAQFFAGQLPTITWQPSDVDSNALSNIKFSNNVLPPISLDVSNKKQWPTTQYDLIYLANTIHIMPWQSVLSMLALIGKCLKPESFFICYGPFKFEHQFTTDSNRQFDEFLKSKNSLMGLRNFEDIKQEALKCDLNFLTCYDLPANNHLLVFKKMSFI